MRRVLVLIGLLVAMALPSAATAHESTRQCSVSVDPGRGGPRDAFRITGRHFPLETHGGSLEVQVEILRVDLDDQGVRLEGQQILILFLLPGIHRWYVDFNQQAEGETARLKPGHYVVAVKTAHQTGCKTFSGFDVARGRAL